MHATQVKPWVTVFAGPARALLMGGLLLAMLPTAALAYPVHKPLFLQKYGTKPDCSLCHDASGSTFRNGYGQDWHDAGESFAAFKAIEGKDSDGDGFTNRQEIKAGTNPGQKKNSPVNPEQPYPEANRIPIPLDQVDLVLAEYRKIDAAETALNAAQLKTLAERTGRPNNRMDAYLTLYFGVLKNKRTSVAFFREFEVNKGERFSFIISMDLEGRFLKGAIFRAGEIPQYKFLPYFKCMRGRGANDIPAPGENGCPSIEDGDAAQREMAFEIRKGLIAVNLALSGGMPSAPTPPPSSTVASPDLAADQEPSPSPGSVETPTAAQSADATKPNDGYDDDLDDELPAAAEPETATAPPPSSSGRLNFDRVKATSSAKVMSSPMAGLLVFATLALMVALIWLSGQLAMRMGSLPEQTAHNDALEPGNETPEAVQGGGAQDVRQDQPRFTRLSDLPPGLRTLAGLGLVTLMLAQAGGALSAYMQTVVIHGSTLEYFQNLSTARLIGISHSHIFGYGLTYGIIGLLVSLTNVKETIKCLVVATFAWCGVFDVISWWGVKFFTPQFEWLMMVTGALNGTLSIFALAIVLRDLLTRPNHRRPTHG